MMFSRSLQNHRDALNQMHSHPKIFKDATNRAPADHWIWDGIHPTYSATS
jgi:hypothetical protein